MIYVLKKLHLSLQKLALPSQKFYILDPAPLCSFLSPFW